MSHGHSHQAFMSFAPTQQQEEAPFEFKPLDLQSLGVPGKKSKKIIVPCEECGRPGCMYEKEVEVEE